MKKIIRNLPLIRPPLRSFKKFLMVALGLLALPCSAACTYTVTHNWGSGFNGEIKVTNDGVQPINGWSVSWRESNATVIGAWNANLSGSNPYTASALSWNATLAPKASVSFGFQATGTAGVQQVTGSLCERSSNSSRTNSVTSSSFSSTTSVNSSVKSSLKNDNSSSRGTSSLASSAKQISSSTSSVTSSVAIENTWTFEEGAVGFCGNSSSIATNHSGYTGTGFFDSENALNASLAWSVSAASTKNYSVKIRFANGSSATRVAGIVVNDKKLFSVNFPSNNNWEQWQTLTINVTLNAGTNSIKAVAETSDGLPNIDNISVIGNSIAPAACPSTPVDCNDVNNQPILYVAADGSAQFKTITAALNSLPSSNTAPTQIRIKPGTYREKIVITKPYITFCGETGKQASTILTYNDGASNIKSDGTTIGTYGSASVSIKTNDISMENLTIENSYGVGTQAVALLAQGQRLQFRNCRLLANQDTLYAHSGTQYYRNCYIQGTVDYIFGAATAVFDNNTIHSVGYGTAVTAPSTDQNVQFGLVFLGGKLTAASNVNTGSVALGRNWRPYGAAAYLGTELGPHISPIGWVKMSENVLDTARFSEYMTTGPGANLSARAYQSTQLNASQAATYTISNIFASWVPSFSR